MSKFEVLVDFGPEEKKASIGKYLRPPSKNAPWSEVVGHLARTALLWSLIGGAGAFAFGLPQTVRDVRVEKGKKKKDDIDVDIEIPDLGSLGKEASLPKNWQVWPLWLASVIFPGLAGVAIHDRVRDRVNNMRMDRKLKKEQERFNQALLTQMLAAQTTGPATDPFAPYEKSGEKQASAIIEGLGDALRGTLEWVKEYPLAGYMAYSGVALPIAAYLAYKDPSTKYPEQIRYMKALRELDKPIEIDAPHAQIVRKELDPKTLNKLRSYAKKHGLISS